MPLTLTAQQPADAAKIASLGEDNEAVMLDPGDEGQLRHLMAVHALGGITPESRPGMFAALEAGVDQAPAAETALGVELDPRYHQDYKNYKNYLAEREKVAG
jgi:hypothetical protein